jgi:hypothetical protein
MTDVAERLTPPEEQPHDPPVTSRGADARRGHPVWGSLLLVVPAVLVVLASVIALKVGEAGRTPANVSAGAPPTTAASATPAAAGSAAARPPTTAHQHTEAAYRPLSPAEQKVFSEQMARAREVAARYPTVADARKAGYKRAGPFAPGAGAHYVAPDNESAKAVTGFDLEHPLAYLYSGNEPTSVLLGIMYYTLTPTAPEGFAGPNDVFHKHNGICLTKGGDGGFDTPFPVDADTTKEQCDGVNGEWMSTTGWMLHVWTAPGWESPAGVFSHDNPLVVCADGTASISNDKLNQGCKGT